MFNGESLCQTAPRSRSIAEVSALQDLERPVFPGELLVEAGMGWVAAPGFRVGARQVPT